MDLNELERKLYTAARQQRADERVPYAFEKRIMACLAAASAPDPMARMAAGLWRAAVSCAGIALLLLAWSYSSPPPVNDLSRDLEATVVATIEHDSGASLQW